MNVLPFIHEGLGNSSYLVESGRTAILVDPDRSFDRYAKAAKERGVTIRAVLETHVHADFVTGAVEALNLTNARVFLPAGAGSRYPHQPVAPAQPFTIEGVNVQPIASPGHTPEHVSYVLRSPSGPPALFSGGSLIAGGAARTDLIDPGQTRELTRQQFRSTHQAFAGLPDETLLYPTHGGGSFCSTGAGGERSSTLGRERADNPVLAIHDESEFLEWFPQTFPAAPGYFFRTRAFNQAAPRLRSQVPLPTPLPPDAFEVAARDALIIDASSKEQYALGHIHGSLSIPFRDTYPVWLGWLVPPETSLVFVLDDVPLGKVIDQSLLVGYERFAGWLAGGIHAWRHFAKPITEHPLIDAQQASRLLKDGAAALDVRETSETWSGTLPGALAIPLGELAARAGEVPSDRPVVVYCGHGERAATGVSVLERAGFSDAQNLDGGYAAWLNANASVATIV
jgi:glyoxylase-like metal-dependent hydrolase (beta-lactamase superfamily II)